MDLGHQVKILPTKPVNIDEPQFVPEEDEERTRLDRLISELTFKQRKIFLAKKQRDKMAEKRSFNDNIHGTGGRIGDAIEVLNMYTTESIEQEDEIKKAQEETNEYIDIMNKRISRQNNRFLELN